MFNPVTIQNDINYTIDETGKTVRHIRYTFSTGSIYGTPTSATLAVDEVVKVRWCRVDKSLKVLELGNYDVGDIIAVCKNTVNVVTDDMFLEDSTSYSNYTGRYKTIRVESANVGGINVYKRAILKKVI